MKIPREKGRGKGLIIVLIIVAILLGGVFSFIYFQKYVDNQKEAERQLMVAFIINALNNQGYVTIKDSEGQSIVLVPYENGGGN